MAYKIPKNLTKYSETFLWGMSFKQFGYASLAALASFFIFAELHFDVWDLQLKILMITPVIVLGAMLIFGRIDEKLASKSNLKNSLRKVGYYDPKIDYFVPIREINDNTVFLKTNKILAILEVIPIDFSILGEEKQEYILNIYSNWLRSLDFEVQITCRSIDLDMNIWLNNLSRIPSVKKDIPRFKAFRKWITEFTEEKNVRNRVFYIAMPMNAQIKSKVSGFKAFTDWMKGKTAQAVNRDDPEYQKALRILENRVASCKESLAACGLEIKRLDNDELLGLYSSYFTNVPGGGRSYLTPVMWDNK